MRPGTPGTEKHLRAHGPALVCVRYREDALGKTRFTTVELVVDEAPMTHRMHPDTWVEVDIPSQARALRRLASEHGAQWIATSGRWRMRWQLAEQLGLDAKAITRRPRVSNRLR